MAICNCGEEYPDARARLGFSTCQLCGDLLAKEEAAQKAKRVGPIWNKGPDMYLGSIEQTREILKTAGGRKNVPIDHNRDVHSNSSSIVSNRSSRRKTASTGGSMSKWVFDHWEFPVDPKTGFRTKRAVLKRTDTDKA